MRVATFTAGGLLFIAAFAATIISAYAVNPDWIIRGWGSCSYYGETRLDPAAGQEARVKTDITGGDCEVLADMYFWNGSSYQSHGANGYWYSFSPSKILTSPDTPYVYGYHQQRDLPDYDATKETFASY